MTAPGTIESLSGVGPRKAEALRLLGIGTISDLLRFYPRRYEDRRRLVRIADLAEGEPAVVRAAVESVTAPPFAGRGGKKIPTRIRVNDGSGALTVIFFNLPWIRNTFGPGDVFWFFGAAHTSLAGPTMAHPAFERAEEGEDFQKIVPVYRVGAGISQKLMRSLTEQALRIGDFPEDPVPAGIAAEQRLAPSDFALRAIHYPEDDSSLRAARYRLVFEELFVLQAGLLWFRSRREAVENGIAFSGAPCPEDFYAILPFAPTGAQKRSVREIYADMEKPRPMHRMLQGDVGSGKTAVAMATCLKAAQNGCQAVVMAPTEILAAQHYKEFSKVYNGIFRVDFLASGLTAKEKTAVKERLAAGETQILIGTHAVIEPDVRFARLGLVVTDEQHRFGVEQRLRLREKGGAYAPDVLVMTATPIPRTLALILYGDLDISVLDELPPGRVPVETRFIGTEKRDDAYAFAEKQLRRGRQAYVVAPQIADGDDDEEGGEEGFGVRSAESLATELRARFPDFRVGLLHGALRPREKDAIMADFVAGETDLLVCTVVIEVGVHVPNATVMIVENAERFGLAQLHQLRGRVGRGDARSYCVLISDSRSEIARKRGEALASTGDGFRIAEMDLALRGPGDFFGVRQHGLPELEIADLAKHLSIVQTAGALARRLLEEDPFLEREENAALRRRLAQLQSRMES